jgi:hypothetical protein
VAGVIRSAQDEGLARSGDPVVLANMLIGMIDGLAVQVILASANMSPGHHARHLPRVHR